MWDGVVIVFLVVADVVVRSRRRWRRRWWGVLNFLACHFSLCVFISRPQIDGDSVQMTQERQFIVLRDISSYLLYGNPPFGRWIAGRNEERRKRHETNGDPPDHGCMWSPPMKLPMIFMWYVKINSLLRSILSFLSPFFSYCKKQCMFSSITNKVCGVACGSFRR